MKWQPLTKTVLKGLKSPHQCYLVAYDEGEYPYDVISLDDLIDTGGDSNYCWASIVAGKKFNDQEVLDLFTHFSILTCPTVIGV